MTPYQKQLLMEIITSDGQQGQVHPAQHPQQYPAQYPMPGPQYPGAFPGGQQGGNGIEIPITLKPVMGGNQAPPMMPMGYPPLPPPQSSRRSGLGLLDIIMVFFGALCLAILLMAASGTSGPF